MKTFKQMGKEWMKDPEFRKEYDALEDEFQYYDELIKARKRAGMTQEQIAEKMGTKREAVTRMESLRGRTSPSMKTLKKYAEAVGCKLQIKLVPTKQTAH
jgi:transcriptional regulator with XRE-family HTH domain